MLWAMGKIIQGGLVLHDLRKPKSLEPSGSQKGLGYNTTNVKLLVLKSGKN